MNPAFRNLIGPLETYSLEDQQIVTGLLGKMISLGFVASFKRIETGPVVRTFFFEPSPSSVLSKLFSKEEDIALTLGVEEVLISRELAEVTIAVPRKDRELIRFDSCLHDLLSSSREMLLPFLGGKTPRGENLFIDLADQPHLLIAGTTGTGKSVFTSQLICSLALSKSPSELELILVDTKRLDLVLFENLPHVRYVIKDIHALRDELLKLLEEVYKRTEILSGSYRNAREFNKDFHGTSSALKYKVLIIDEFAEVLKADKAYISSLEKDMKPQSIQSLVERLAQISRAAGVYIILATQRPSVKVISGEIKANFPARISFKLPSMGDSRVILDSNGAERLLGKGDFLYKISGSDTIKRAHSAFVTQQDIALIIDQSESIRMQYERKELS